MATDTAERDQALVTAARVVTWIAVVAVWGALALLVGGSASPFPPGAWLVSAAAVAATVVAPAAPRPSTTGVLASVAGSHLPWILLPTVYAFLALPVTGFAVAAAGLGAASDPGRRGAHLVWLVSGLVLGMGALTASWFLISP